MALLEGNRREQSRQHQFRQETLARNFDAEHKAQLYKEYGAAIHAICFPCSTYHSLSPFLCSCAGGALFSVLLGAVGGLHLLKSWQKVDAALKFYITPGLGHMRGAATIFLGACLALSGVVVAYGLRERSRREGPGCDHNDKAQLACFCKCFFKMWVHASMILALLCSIMLMGVAEGVVILLRIVKDACSVSKDAVVTALSAASGVYSQELVNATTVEAMCESGDLADAAASSVSGLYGSVIVLVSLLLLFSYWAKYQQMGAQLPSRLIDGRRQLSKEEPDKKPLLIQGNDLEMAHMPGTVPYERDSWAGGRGAGRGGSGRGHGGPGRAGSRERGSIGRGLGAGRGGGDIDPLDLYQQGRAHAREKAPRKH